MRELTNKEILDIAAETGGKEMKYFVEQGIRKALALADEPEPPDSELPPCPECEGNLRIVDDDEGHETSDVSCDECGQIFPLSAVSDADEPKPALPETPGAVPGVPNRAGQWVCGRLPDSKPFQISRSEMWMDVVRHYIAGRTTYIAERHMTGRPDPLFTVCDPPEPEPAVPGTDRRDQWFVEADSWAKICGPITESRQAEFDWEHYGDGWLLTEKWIQNGNYLRIPPPPAGQDMTGWECREPGLGELWYDLGGTERCGLKPDDDAIVGTRRWIPKASEPAVAKKPWPTLPLYDEAVVLAMELLPECVAYLRRVPLMSIPNVAGALDILAKIDAKRFDMSKV